MAVTTFEAIIENGQVRLPREAVLPEKQTVYVVVPDSVGLLGRTVPSVRLANPDDTRRFALKATWGKRLAH